MPAWTMLRMRMLKTRKGAKPVTREASDQRVSPFKEKSWYFKVLTMVRWMLELELEESRAIEALRSKIEDAQKMRGGGHISNQGAARTTEYSNTRTL